jgi:cell division septation protein DedD
MSADFPHANARLTQAARHWADGEVTQDAWRRERREIIGELCSKRADCGGEDTPSAAAPVARPAESVTSPQLPVSPAKPVPAEPASQPAPADVADDEVLILGVLLLAVIGGALFIFFMV